MCTFNQFKLADFCNQVINELGFKKPTAIQEKVISEALLPFYDLDKIYESDEIFAIFKVRLPKIETYSQEEMKELLEDLEMDEYDEFEYLRKTKGMLVTDKYILEEEK